MRKRFFIEFDPGCRRASARHNDGVEECVFVLTGKPQLVLNGREVAISEKQAIRFRADLPHGYRKPFGEKCAVCNMIFYPDD